MGLRQRAAIVDLFTLLLCCTILACVRVHAGLRRFGAPGSTAGARFGRQNDAV
jgi:hypothetical protein